MCVVGNNGVKKCSLCAGGYVLRSNGDVAVCEKELDN